MRTNYERKKSHDSLNQIGTYHITICLPTGFSVFLANIKQEQLIV